MRNGDDGGKLNNEESGMDSEASVEKNEREEKDGRIREEEEGVKGV